MNHPDHEANARIDRAPALRPSVPLYRHMLYGSGLSHPLDFVVLMHIHFMCEDGKEFTVHDVVNALRTEGVRNANGKGDGLVGSKAVYESVARLREAGFLHRSQSNGGSFGKVTYTFHEFPATDPTWTPPPVPDSPPSIPVPLTGEAVPASNSVPAGHTASPHKASADKASAHRRTGKTRVPAGHTASPHRRNGKPSPPHPPEGGGTTPPNPPKTGRAARWVAACALDPADHTPTPEQTKAADDFLQDLPGKWQCGPAKARDLAPLLASRAHTQGWDLDDFLALELIRDDGNNPARNPVSTLPYRIRDLRRYRAEPAPADTPANKPGPDGLAPWCTKCNHGEFPRMTYQRTVELPDGRDVPCKDCHPKHTRRANT